MGTRAFDVEQKREADFSGATPIRNPGGRSQERFRLGISTVKCQAFFFGTEVAEGDVAEEIDPPFAGGEMMLNPQIELPAGGADTGIDRNLAAPENAGLFRNSPVNFHPHVQAIQALFAPLN